MNWRSEDYMHLYWQRVWWFVLFKKEMSPLFLPPVRNKTYVYGKREVKYQRQFTGWFFRASLYIYCRSKKEQKYAVEMWYKLFHAIISYMKCGIERGWEHNTYFLTVVLLLFLIKLWMREGMRILKYWKYMLAVFSAIHSFKKDQSVP